MRFEVRGPYVVFHDDKPGNHARMFVADGQDFPFHVEASSFNDRARTYSWAFRGSVKDGERVVFATEDRQASGLMKRGSIVMEGDVVEPLRSRDEVLGLRPRPVPMLRSK